MKMYNKYFLDDYKKEHPGSVDFDYTTPGGHGHMSIGFEIFPLSKKDMKIFDGILTLAAAREIADYFRAYLAQLERFEKIYDTGREDDSKEKSKIVTDKKRFIAMLEALHDMYDEIELYEPEQEVVKVKKASFYTSYKGEPKQVDGVQFDINGYRYGAYRENEHKTWIVDLLTGCALKYYKGSPKNAPQYLDFSIMATMANIRKKSDYAAMINSFKAQFEKSGLVYPEALEALANAEHEKREAEQAAPADAPEKVTASEPTAEQTGEKATTNTAEKSTTEPKKAPTTPTTASEPEQTPTTDTSRAAADPAQRQNIPPYSLFIYHNGAFTTHAIKRRNRRRTVQGIQIGVDKNKRLYKANKTLYRVHFLATPEPYQERKKALTQGKSPPFESVPQEKIRYKNQTPKIHPP